jgi:hypothetical protein
MMQCLLLGPTALNGNLASSGVKLDVSAHHGTVEENKGLMHQRQQSGNGAPRTA